MVVNPLLPINFPCEIYAVWDVNTAFRIASPYAVFLCYTLGPGKPNIHAVRVYHITPIHCFIVSKVTLD